MAREERVKEKDLNDVIASLDLNEFLPHRLIRIQPMSASLHYSHAVFEGMSMIKSGGGLTLFHPWLNLERMRKNAGIVGLDMSRFADKAVISNLFSLAALNGFDGGRCRIPVIRRGGKNINRFYVRPLLFVESDGFGLSANMRSRLLTSVFQIGEYMHYEPGEGIETFLYPFPRKLPFPSVKASCNYQLGIVARNRMAGFNRANGTRCMETLFTDEEGHFVEGCVENIAFIRGRELLTPHPMSGALPGITLRLVRSIAQRMGLTFRFGSFKASELRESDCMFLSGNAVGVVPVSSVSIPDGEFNPVKTIELASAGNEFFGEIKEEYERMETGQEEHASLHERMEDWVSEDERLRLNSVGKRFMEKALEGRNSALRESVTINSRGGMPAGLPTGASMLRRFGVENSYSGEETHDKRQDPGKFDRLA